MEPGTDQVKKQLALRFLTKVAGVLLLAGFLAGCGLAEGDGRHLQPLSSSVTAQLRNMGSSPGEAMLIRLYKDESSLEVWKRVKGGTYKYFKSYEICNWSGELGPKFKEGDRQAPEGFYNITPGLMNPNSNYYLAFNTGFPNKFDRAHGRTGSDLMIHGDCSSRGCYAMTDELIAEIYALGREAFRGGQRNFQLQLYPFRMTSENLAKHRKSPHIEFWRNLKEGYDAFEISRRLTKWDVCEGRYIFNAKGGPLRANGVCPAATTEPELMALVAAKQSTDFATFEIASGKLDEKDAKQALKRAKAAAEKVALAERTAKVNKAVNERSDAVSNAVGGFFSGLFGGGDNAASNGAPAQPGKLGPAPVPAPRINRG